MSSFPVLLAVMIIEHFDMSTDALFTGSASACSARIHDKWIHSWKIIPYIGPVVSGMLGEIGFGGFALAVFVCGAYIPQFVNILSLLAPGAIFGTAITVAIWTQFDWYVGAPVMLIAIGLTDIYLAKRQWSTAFNFWDVANTRTNRDVVQQAMHGGFVFFEFRLDPDDKVDRALFFNLNKLIFENLVQLWIQASYFSFSFEMMNELARYKVMFSICLGLFVSLTKLLPMFPAFVELNRGHFFELPEGLALWFCILCLVLCLLFVVWTAAKVYFAFTCPSHVWNLAGGCVSFD